jgi:hypothetical protein
MLQERRNLQHPVITECEPWRASMSEASAVVGRAMPRDMKLKNNASRESEKVLVRVSIEVVTST